MSMKKILIKCKGVENIPIDKFIELQGNLKELSVVNYEKLKKSILKHGFSFPVICWKQKNKYYILDAHQRIKVLKKMRGEGYLIPDLPTCYTEAINKKDAAEKLLLLNSNFGKITEEGLYEFNTEFGIDFKDFKMDIDLPDFDLEKFDLGYYQEDNEKLDDVPEPPKKAKSKLGDLFLIDGRHRVLCGDSTKKEDVEVLMDGKKADMVFTDPPYGMNLDTDYTKAYKKMLVELVCPQRTRRNIEK